MSNRHPGLELLRGDAKGKFIRDHLAEIQVFYALNGRRATLNEYVLSDWTLDNRILDRIPEDTKRFDHYYERSDIIAEIAREEARRANIEIRDLKRQWQLFTTLVAKAIMDGFLKPLLASKIELPAELNMPDDEYDIAGFVRELEARAARVKG